MVKVLVIGGNGLLGEKLVEELSNRKDYDVYGTYLQSMYEHEHFYRVDITMEKEIDYVFEKVDPDVTVLCSAYTDVDKCEQNKKKAYHVNVTGTKHIANMVKGINGKLLYISTDYVFDGIKGNYSETDKVNPINYYGKTKLLGEQCVQQICSDYVICRTSVIYGTNKKNFALWLIDELSKEKSVRIIDNQFVSATYNVDLSKQIVSLIDHNQNGIFHTAGGSQISRYTFSLMLAEIFGFNPEFIKPVKLKDFNWIADRPADSTLDVSKIAEFKKPYAIKKALTAFKQEYDVGYTDKNSSLKNL